MQKLIAKVVGEESLGDPHHKGNNQKGITLIALVITIIVLLILAGVTISMVLGDDGIIAQAQQAKEANEKGIEKEAIEIAKGEAALMKYNKQTAMDVTELNNKLGTAKTENTTVAKVIDGVPIPIGFSYVEGTTKDKGLIIVDGSGNEFVWIPVDTSENNATPMFEENNGTFTGKLYDWQNWTGEGNPEERTNYWEPGVLSYPSGETGTDKLEANINAIKEEKYSTLSEQFQAEYNAMAESVKLYKGFYVGRYETSWTGSKVASVKTNKSEEIMTGATLLEDTWTTGDESVGNKATWYGLYAKQKELYNKESDSVVSAMIYGSQWDAIMNWMKDIPNPNSTLENKTDRVFIKDSTGMGHYMNGIFNDVGMNAIATGSNDNYKVKNIYDLAGNFAEWTQEAASGTQRANRGAYFFMSYSYKRPVSYVSSEIVSGGNAGTSSRLQLYIK